MSGPRPEQKASDEPVSTLLETHGHSFTAPGLLGENRFLKAWVSPRPAWKQDRHCDAQRKTQALCLCVCKEIRFKDRRCVPPWSSSSVFNNPARLPLFPSEKLGAHIWSAVEQQSSQISTDGTEAAHRQAQQAALLPEKSDR